MRNDVQVAVIGVAAGVIATVVKSKSEPLLQQLFEARLPPTPAEKDLVGADPAGAPEQMPPAVIVAGATEKLTGRDAPDAVVSAGSQLIHFGTGTAAAVGYAFLVERFPLANLGGGAVAGLALYAVTHGSGFAAVGLQPPPTQMPTAAVGWEATSHAIYGLTVELIRRVATVATQH